MMVPNSKEIKKALIPSASIHDEIKTVACGMALIELLGHSGILYRAHNEYSNLTAWELS